jgi:hypothetical protein
MEHARSTRTAFEGTSVHRATRTRIWQAHLRPVVFKPRRPDHSEGPTASRMSANHRVSTLFGTGGAPPPRPGAAGQSHAASAESLLWLARKLEFGAVSGSTHGEQVPCWIGPSSTAPSIASSGCAQAEQHRKRDRPRHPRLRLQASFLHSARHQVRGTAPGPIDDCARWLARTETSRR